MKPSNYLEKKTPPDKYWRVQIVSESSGSQFFRTTTGPDALDESRFAMTFLTILGVMKILYIFTLVLEEKIGKEIPKLSRFEFLEKFLANNFALSDADNNTMPLNRIRKEQIYLCWEHY